MKNENNYPTIDTLTVDILTLVKLATHSESNREQYKHNLMTALGYIETLQEAIIALKVDIKREIRN